MAFKGHFQMPTLLPSILPFLILQLALSSPLTSLPSFFCFHPLFIVFFFFFIRTTLSGRDKRREKGKSGEGRGKGGREMGFNASILSTPSLKLLLFTAPFFYAISNIKVGQVSCVYVSIQECVYHCSQR